MNLIKSTLFIFLSLLYVSLDAHPNSTPQISDVLTCEDYQRYPLQLLAEGIAEKIAGKERNLSNILRGGFLNLHQTMTSGGNTSLILRAHRENTLIETHYAQTIYSLPLAKLLRPKSAAIWYDAPEGVQPSTPTESGIGYGSYGKFVAVLKDAVKRRSTWSVGDSLDYPYRIYSFYYNGPDLAEGAYEVQTYGNLDLRDVDHFVVFEEMTEENRKTLEESGFKVVDGKRNVLIEENLERKQASIEASTELSESRIRRLTSYQKLLCRVVHNEATISDDEAVWFGEILFDPFVSREIIHSLESMSIQHPGKLSSLFRHPRFPRRIFDARRIGMLSIVSDSTNDWDELFSFFDLEHLDSWRDFLVRKSLQRTNLAPILRVLSSPLKQHLLGRVWGVADSQEHRFSVGLLQNIANNVDIETQDEITEVEATLPSQEHRELFRHFLAERKSELDTRLRVLVRAFSYRDDFEPRWLEAQKKIPAIREAEARVGLATEGESEEAVLTALENLVEQGVQISYNPMDDISHLNHQYSVFEADFVQPFLNHPRFIRLCLSYFSSGRNSSNVHLLGFLRKWEGEIDTRWLEELHQLITTEEKETAGLFLFPIIKYLEQVDLDAPHLEAFVDIMILIPNYGIDVKLELLRESELKTHPKFNDWVYRIENPGGDLGELTPVQRYSGGYHQGRWFADAQGREWFLKSDPIYSELQTSAEVISSEIYRVLGYITPETYIVYREGRRYSAALSLGHDYRPSVYLENYHHSLMRRMRFVAAYLKDWDRLRVGPNNFEIDDEKFASYDFGGTLGARSRKDHKPGPIFSDAIGSFCSDCTFEEIFLDFNLGHLEANPVTRNHPWFNLTIQDAAILADDFMYFLHDKFLERTVRKARYSDDRDTEYMIHALKKRRDTIIDGIQRVISRTVFDESDLFVPALLETMAEELPCSNLLVSPNGRVSIPR